MWTKDIANRGVYKHGDTTSACVTSVGVRMIGMRKGVEYIVGNGSESVCALQTRLCDAKDVRWLGGCAQNIRDIVHLAE
jgi:hypothetical protein